MKASTCQSDLVFDRLLVGELEEAQEQEIAAHTAQCERCRKRLAELEGDREVFQTLGPPLRSGERTVKSSRPRRLWLWGPAAAALATAVLVLALHWPEKRTHSTGTRLKGRAFSLAYFVNRQGRSFRGKAGDDLHPGDAVRFAVKAQEDAYLLIVSRDGAGQRSVYYSAGPRAAPLRASSEERALEESVVLDEVLGPEEVYGFFCNEPARSQVVLDQWSEGEVPTLKDCVRVSLRWNKVQP